MTHKPTIGIAIITYRARHLLPHCLPPLLASSLKPRVLVVNSSSNDGTVEYAKELGAETLVVPRHAFNHGTTRELARKHLGTDIVVMVTPDAYALDGNMIEHLVTPLKKGEASVAYARQIAHDGADVFEAFARDFNYPSQSQLRGLEDKALYGVYTLFCSNSCAAYLNSALDEIGGFQHVLMGEDTFAVADLLQRGHKIAYVAEAVVKHSHRYSLKQEFQRHFDIGLVRKQQEEIIRIFGKDSARGKRYFIELQKRILKSSPHLLPYAYLQTAAKWIGYQLGRRSVNASLNWKKKWSSQDFYWESLESLHK